MNILARVLTFVLLAGLACGQSAPAKKQESGALARRLDALVQEMASSQKIPGTSVTIMQSGEILYETAHGLADLENNVPMTPKTVSRIGSVSKVITAVAVLQVKGGKLSLEDPIQKHCTAFPEKGSKVTVSQVLSHLGGIRHYKSGQEFLNTKHYENVTSALAIFKDDPLVHEPGSKYLYSSWGYNLLSCVVETVSRQSFSKYVRERIIEPAAMFATTPDDAAAIVPNRARYYSANREGTLLNSPYVDLSDRLGAGGFLSTSGDVARLGKAMLNHEILTQGEFLRMRTAAKTTNGETVPYGQGLVPIMTGERKAAYHTGESMGASAILYMEWETDLVIAILWNKDSIGRPRLKLAQDMADAVYAASIK